MRVNSGAFADTLRHLLPISSDCSRQPHRIMIAAQEVYSRKRRPDSTHFNSFGAGASPLSRFSPFRNTAQELHIQCTGLSPQYFPVKYLIVFLLVIIGPVVISAANYLVGDRRGNWQTADRSSAGLLPKASEHPDALIRVYAARTVRWRGIFAVHSWIIVKERAASQYTRYDYTAWGEPIRVDGFAPDGRWFGALPETVLSVDGEDAERLIPKIRSVIETYKFRTYGDYHPWPGPNSNTFVQAALDAVPELNVVLPPTAIGKDYPYHGEWYGLTPSRTGIFLNLAGYLGVKVGWVEGIELNLLGGVIGMDIRRPAIKLPALGRLGMQLAP
jgi:Protein of unknown function (DUF3750)